MTDATAPALHPPARDSLPWTLGLGAVLLVGLALRVWLSLHDDGIYWPDEVYQSLEPAHRLVFGYGLVAWEFLEGARNWFFPGLIGGWLELFRGAEPRHYLLSIRLLMSLVGIACGLGVFRLVRRSGGSGGAALTGAALFTLAPVSLYFSTRALSETASALPVVFGLSAALPLEASRRSRLLGAGLLAIATLLRLQCGLFCAALVVVLLARRAWRPALEVLGVLLVGAFLYGLLDRLTWGNFFHSAIVYLRFNLVEGKASGWGTAEALFYLRVLYTSMPLLTLLCLPLVLLGGYARPPLFLIALAFLLAHMAIPHKELRFLLPALPLFFALAGLGLDRAVKVIPAGAVGALVVVAALLSVFRFHQLTFKDLGQYDGAKAEGSAYDDFGNVNRLLLAAHDLPNLCGVKIEVAHLAWTGGYSYLHRDVPVYGFNGPPRQSGMFNAVLTVPRAVPPTAILASEGPFVLARLFDGPCRPDAQFSWKLP